MSHLEHRGRGPSGGPARARKMPPEISGTALPRVEAGVTGRIRGFEPRDAGGGRRRHENGLAAQTRSSVIFRARAQERARIEGSPGPPEKHFPVILRFSGRVSDFPVSFRSVSGGVRCLTMGHKCLIVRHVKTLIRRGFRAWCSEEAILGFVFGTFMSHPRELMPRQLTTSCGMTGRTRSQNRAWPPNADGTDLHRPLPGPPTSRARRGAPRRRNPF